VDTRFLFPPEVTSIHSAAKKQAMDGNKTGSETDSGGRVDAGNHETMSSIARIQDVKWAG
jgi:hypothetical protein